MFCMESSCRNCVYKSMSPDGPYCRRGHKYHDFTLCSEWKGHPKPDLDIRANIPEEDQVQKKPDFLAKCMNIPMVSFAKSEVEGVAELVCYQYCKFPELIKKEDILHRICEGCPLNALMTHIQGGSNYVK